MERWRVIAGYEGHYEVSDHGGVRSVERILKNKMPSGKVRQRLWKQKTLSQVRSGAGDHRAVVLSRNGKSERKLVHHLVLEAFVGPRPPGKIGLHWDDDPDNNTLENLRWGTHSDNQDDKVRNGNHHNQRKTHCSRGHLYSPENTILDQKPNERVARRCRICHKKTKREWARKQRGQI